ncbi:MAG: DUF433 domain-containing protein [Thermomicrobiales bacterium]|nr:DUF433 domain-containing protein [Thermomicrobiales bacterium]
MSTPTTTERITCNPDVLLGKPTIRGTRIPVYLIVELVEAGHTAAEIVDDYPLLTDEDVEAAVEYAADIARRTEIRPLHGA